MFQFSCIGDNFRVVMKETLLTELHVNFNYGQKNILDFITTF